MHVGYKNPFRSGLIQWSGNPPRLFTPGSTSCRSQYRYKDYYYSSIVYLQSFGQFPERVQRSEDQCSSKEKHKQSENQQQGLDSSSIKSCGREKFFLYVSKVKVTFSQCVPRLSSSSYLSLSSLKHLWLLLRIYRIIMSNWILRCIHT